VITLPLETRERLRKIGPLLEEYHNSLEELRKKYPCYNMHPDDPLYEEIGRNHFRSFVSGLSSYWRKLKNAIKDLDERDQD